MLFILEETHMSNYGLEPTAPSVHGSCLFAAQLKVSGRRGKTRAPRPAAQAGR